MKLVVLVSTLNKGIHKVKNVILSPRDDVQYIISHQYTNEYDKSIPLEILRDDITISQIKGSGVTKSRNNAIRLASGDIAVFADDDVKYTHKYFDTIIDIFSNNNSLDVGIFKIKTSDGILDYKSNYPSKEMKLIKLPFFISTIEIAFKIKSIKEKGILFDERFGAGQSLLIGSDESIFILDCIKAELNVWYFPQYIVEHPLESSSKKIGKYDKRKVSVTGAFDSRINGWISIPKACLGTIKYMPDLIRNKKNPFVYLKERLFAAIYILFSNQTKS